MALSIGLLAFFGSVIVYFTFFQPHLGYPEESIRHASVKLLPVMSLLFMLKSSPEVPKTSRVRSWSIIALVFSMGGDVALVWRQGLFLAGIALFGVAQIFYTIAFGMKTCRVWTGLFCVVTGGAIDYWVLPSIKDNFLKFMVAGYTILIFVMVWRAMDNCVSNPGFGTGLRVIGALVFTLSDFLIAVDRWIVQISGNAGYVMATYYAAQCLIATSVFMECSTSAKKRL